MDTDYYEILGVSPDADAAQIKARYRRMVRENHPDIAADKIAAHARIQLIIAAWTTLSQPHLRREYDERRRRQNAEAPAAAVPDSASSPRAPQQPALEIDPKVAAQKRKRVQQVMGGNERRSVNPRTKLLTMVFDAAQMYHVEGRIEDAIRVCNNVLRADPTNAEAAVLLGDIYVEQNRKDVALSMYERAIRLQPSNQLYRQKWEKLRHSAPAQNEPATVPKRAVGPNPWSRSDASQPLSERFARREAAGENHVTPATAPAPQIAPTDAPETETTETVTEETASSAAPNADAETTQTSSEPPPTLSKRADEAASSEGGEKRAANSFFARWRARRS